MKLAFPAYFENGVVPKFYAKTESLLAEVDAICTKYHKDGYIRVQPQPSSSEIAEEFAAQTFQP